MIKQLQLCTKQGNGVCLNCSGIYKSTVHCTHTIAKDYNFQLEILDEMMDFLIYNNIFSTKKEILEHFDARELEEKSNG